MVRVKKLNSVLFVEKKTRAIELLFERSDSFVLLASTLDNGLEARYRKERKYRLTRRTCGDRKWIKIFWQIRCRELTKENKRLSFSQSSINPLVSAFSTLNSLPSIVLRGKVHFFLSRQNLRNVFVVSCLHDIGHETFCT